MMSCYPFSQILRSSVKLDPTAIFHFYGSELEIQIHTVIAKFILADGLWCILGRWTQV